MLEDFAGHEKVPDVCAGCKKPILDRFYLLAADLLWHLHCLKCSVCSQNLDTDVSCFTRGGNIYCREDYYRLFYCRCTRCGNIIKKEDFVMKAKEYVYHIECFFCQFCENPLSAGDTAVVAEGKIFCATHGEQPFPDQLIPSLLQCTTDSAQKGRPRKRKCNVQNAENNELSKEINYKYGILDNSPGNLSVFFDGGQSPRGSPSSRSKRVRTSFKHHQLRTMKSYFSVNQNPDAKDLKQLAQKTGLSKRVLQVWFQNARAKFRRNVVRHEGGQKSSQNSYTFMPTSTAVSAISHNEINNDNNPNISDESVTGSQFNHIY